MNKIELLSLSTSVFFVASIVLAALKARLKTEVSELQTEIRQKIISCDGLMKRLDAKIEDCEQWKTAYNNAADKNRALEADIQVIRHTVDAKGSF